jgi:hypothetical protein
MSHQNQPNEKESTGTRMTFSLNSNEEANTFTGRFSLNGFLKWWVL